jgi:hypothetical protein
MVLPGKAQVPAPGELFLDHVGHFVPDIAAAAEAARAYGFTTTDIAIHGTTGPNGTRLLSGTGNICIMLEAGYIEVLFAASDTPLSRELTGALARYPGLHLFALSSADAEAEHERLARAGFATRPLTRLRRAIAEGGPEAAFTVARVAAAEFPEGRVQICTHHTPDLVWPPSLTQHANGIVALADVVIVVEDAATSAERFARLAGREVRAVPGGFEIALDRGAIRLLGAEAGRPWLPEPATGLTSPALPCSAACGLITRSLDESAAFFASRGIPATRDCKALRLPFPPALGLGDWYLAEDDADFPWRQAP